MLHNSVKSLKITEVKVLVAQSYPTLCDPMDCSLTGFSVHGILQAIILQWVAILFSRGSSWPRDRTQVSCIAGRFFTAWVTREAHNLHSHSNIHLDYVPVFVLDSTTQKMTTTIFYETLPTNNTQEVGMNGIGSR